MNLTEIKNADKWELYEYVKDTGYEVFPTSSKKRLRGSNEGVVGEAS